MGADWAGSKNPKYKHGGAGTKLYDVGCSMRYRCDNPASEFFNRYGGRGITVCGEWESNFAEFRDWAYKNGYKEGLSIDRINNDGPYSPSNCRFANRKMQCNNQSTTTFVTYKESTKSLHEWADIAGINPSTLYFRIVKYGWPVERALTEKVRLHVCKQEKALGKEQT